MKKPKKLTVSKAKTQAWKAFSKWVRYRKFKELGFVRCVTCEVALDPKKAQAGHFIPGRHNGVLFDERNVWPQCMRCNVFLKGNPVVYYKWMLENQGQDVIDELIELDKRLKQFKVQDLIEIKEKYEGLLG